ncbi:MAG TPA: DUF2125 domain-containing protein [Paracoccaceae bacterium]|nr:DUF2125 domain-containing protein [Paracoccaceae bacterium]
MKTRTHLSVSAIVAALLCANAARADVTAEQVWQDWKDYYAQLGQTVSVGAEAMEGDTLVARDVKFTSEATEATTEGTISEVRLQEMGDGTVEITLPKEIPVVIHSKPAEGTPSDVTMLLTNSDLKIVASGTPESMDFDLTSAELGMSMDEAKVEGETAPVKIQITATGNKGKYHTEKGVTRILNSEITSDTVTFAAAGADPESGSTFNMTGTINGVGGTGTMAMPTDASTKDMNAAMQAGMTIAGDFLYTDGAYKIEGTGSDGDFVAESTGGAGKLNFSMSKDGLSYGGEAADSNVTLTSPSIPFPIEVALAQTAFNLAMPVSKSDAPKPAELLLKIVDLKVSDGLWNMVDPGEQLPRDPATLVIDLSGAIRPLIDLFDPKQTEELAAGSDPAAATPPAPFEVSEAKINQLQLKAVGAELTGTGAMTFDNSATPPKPLGAIDLNLTGANALMDKLVAMGLLPEDQVMGARMMLGMFTVPAGEDAVTSKIEFKEDGGIYANGQRIQ